MKTENVIGGNAKVVRNINRSMILNIIRTKQPISRTKIAKLTGLNKSTVSSIVADLIDEEFVYEQKTFDPSIGRNPLDLSLKIGKYFIGAISIDAALTRFAVTNIDGSVLGTSQIEYKPGRPEEFIELCLDELDKLCKRLNIKSLEGLGLSIAGIVDSKNLIVNFAPNLGWEDFHIGDVVKRLKSDIRILTVGNDAKCSALAELWYGSHKISLSNFVFLQIGPGIGSGIVVENKVLDGEFHASGEVGHMVLYEDGEECICGNRGCWEKYASDRATINRYLVKKNGSLEQASNITIETIIEAANNNDSIAREVLEETGHYLGLGIANIIKIIDPHVIIVGGRIVQCWDIIYPEINQVVKERTFYGKKKIIAILPTSLPVRPRLLGAATLAIKVIFDDYKITF
jgi:predicted NBD/HSP70 family sugar kinase